MNYVFGRILSTFPLLRRYSDRIDEIAHAFPQGFKTGWPWDGILAALICVLVSYVCHVFLALLCGRRSVVCCFGPERFLAFPFA